MLKYFFLLLFSTSVLPGFAQGALTQPLLPTINLTLTNGESFGQPQLKQGPVILVYFSPDCGHCKQFITDLLQREKLIKDRQVILATFVELNTLKSFEETMGLRKFPNMRVGTEGKGYALVRALDIRKFPFVALYDSSRRLVKSFEGEQPFKEIVDAIQKL